MKPLNTWSSCLDEIGLDDNTAYLTPLLSAIPLTEALQAWHADFTVEVLHLGESLVWGDEQHLMATDSGFAREVLLRLNQHNVVWARSVCEADAFKWQEIVRCGNQPLGLRLYQLPLERSEFEYARLSPEHPANPSDQTIISRRSSFALPDGSKLLLTESFLPDLKHYEP